MSLLPLLAPPLPIIQAQLLSLFLSFEIAKSKKEKYVLNVTVAFISIMDDAIRSSNVHEIDNVYNMEDLLKKINKWS